MPVSLLPRAYCHSDFVIEHVYHEVEADSLLPVNVRIAYGQLLAVPPPHLHKVALTRALLPETQSFSVKDERKNITDLPDKEEKVIAVNAPVRLKEEVSDEEVCPVGRVPGA